MRDTAQAYNQPQTMQTVRFCHQLHLVSLRAGVANAASALSPNGTIADHDRTQPASRSIKWANLEDSSGKPREPGGGHFRGEFPLSKTLERERRFARRAKAYDATAGTGDSRGTADDPLPHDLLQIRALPHWNRPLSIRDGADRRSANRALPARTVLECR